MKTLSLDASTVDKMFLPADDETIISVENANGFPIKFYDDGYGPIFLWETPCGNFSFLAGVIRAKNFYDAYEILCDEFLPECDMSMEEIIAEYGQDFMNDAAFCDECGFRPNGANTSDKYCHGIYSQNAGGEYLQKASGEYTSSQLDRPYMSRVGAPTHGIVITYQKEE